MKLLPLALAAAAALVLLLALVRVAALIRRNRRRRRPRPLDPLTVLLFPLAVGLLLGALLLYSRESLPPSPESTPPDTVAPTVEATEPPADGGWVEKNGRRVYENADGTLATGWLDLDGKRYYFGQDGAMCLGWKRIEGRDYYFRPDGSMARGHVEVDGEMLHFGANGQQVLLVNPWNEVPENYTPNLVDVSADYGVANTQVDASCLEALIRMIDDCNAEAPRAHVVSGYRDFDHQTRNYERKVNYYLNQGYTQADAQREAATEVAVPGTSEHQLGLAVDIIDTRLWDLTAAQADQPAQQWLMENSWRYGFIFRYPEGKLDITGIIYEPWHYRYVGQELAAEIHDSGLTLEEYLDSLS